jgi:arylsulfatase A-like enzyme
LYLSFQDVHWPLQAPEEYISRYKGLTDGDLKRQMVCAMATHLDDAIGNVTQALRDANLWDDTLIVFTSDNGGPTNGDELTSSNNYPLRGGKNTLWQGGVKVPTIVRGARLGESIKGTVVDGKMHVTDWTPTLVKMASGRNWTEFMDNTQPSPIYGDGISVWDMFEGLDVSPRDWVLLEAHPEDAEDRSHGDALIVGDWKLFRYVESANTIIQNGWFPPPGQNPRETKYTVNCVIPTKQRGDPDECQLEWCLYNLVSDPCEYHDVSKLFPEVVNKMV